MKNMVLVRAPWFCDTNFTPSVNNCRCEKKMEIYQVPISTNIPTY